MRTVVSNEVAILQARSLDGKKVLSIIKSGLLFRFVEDTQITEPATHGLDSYEYPEETYRSGLYETLEEAKLDALVFAPWIVEFQLGGFVED